MQAAKHSPQKAQRPGTALRLQRPPEAAVIVRQQMVEEAEAGLQKEGGAAAGEAERNAGRRGGKQETVAAQRKGMEGELQGDREKILQERMGSLAGGLEDSAGRKGRPGKALCVVERQALQEGEWEGAVGLKGKLCRRGWQALRDGTAGAAEEEERGSRRAGDDLRKAGQISIVPLRQIPA